MTTTAVALLLFLIGICALAVAYLDARSAWRAVEHRLDLVGPPEILAAANRADDAVGKRAMVNHALLALFSFGMKQSWGLRLSGLSLLAIGAGAMAAIWTLVSGILGLANWIGAGCGAIAFFALPRLRLRMMQERIDRQFIEIFPDGLEMIVRMLRAGLPVTAAIREVAKEAVFPLNQVFTDLANQMDIGVDFEDALRSMAERVKLSDFRYFSVATSLQRRTGGNLAATLELLCDVVRKKRSLRLKANAVTAEVRMTAYILGSVPFFLVGVLLITSPHYLEPLVTDPRGNVITAVAIGLLVLAFVVIRQMMRGITRPR